MKMEFSPKGVVFTELHELLNACGIQTIPQAKIDVYMAEQLAANKGNLAGRLFHRLGYTSQKDFDTLSKTVDKITLFFCGALFIGGVLVPALIISMSCVDLLFGQATWSNLWWSLGSIPAGAASVLLSILLVTVLDNPDLAPKIIGPASWKRKPLTQEAYMPLKAIRLTKQVRDLYPSFTHEVDVLLQNEIVIDPVYWIINPNTGEKAAVMIWNEHLEEVHL